MCSCMFECDDVIQKFFLYIFLLDFMLCYNVGCKLMTDHLMGSCSSCIKFYWAYCVWLARWNIRSCFCLNILFPLSAGQVDAGSGAQGSVCRHYCKISNCITSKHCVGEPSWMASNSIGLFFRWMGPCVVTAWVKITQGRLYMRPDLIQALNPSKWWWSVDVLPETFSPPWTSFVKLQMRAQLAPWWGILLQIVSLETSGE